jgi:hypothetical protein
MGDFTTSLWVGTCAGIADSILASDLVLDAMGNTLPGIVSIARTHQLNKLNGAFYSFIMGMTGFNLWEAVKKPFFARK